MSPVQCVCPTCRTALQIAQALPVTVRCPKCGAAFTVGPPPAPQPTPLHIPRPTQPLPLINVQSAAVLRPQQVVPGIVASPAQRRKRLLALCTAGGGALVVLAIILIVLCLRGGSAREEVGASEEIVGQKQQNIDRAIRKGVAFLKQKVLAGGTLYTVGDSRGGGAQVGAVALAGLTLLECGVSPDDPAVRSAIDTIRRQTPSMSFTYSIALSILFLDRLNNGKDRPADPADQARIRSLGLRLIAGQNYKAGWAYFCTARGSSAEARLLADLKAGRFKPGDGVEGGSMRGYDDNSIGQFATLALWAARKHGLPVRITLRAVGERYRAKQNGDGSWNYHDQNGYLRDTSTCAGLIGLAVAEGIEDEERSGKADKHAIKDITRDPAVQKGLEFLTRVVGKEPALSEAEREQARRHTEELEDVLRRAENATPEEKMRLAMEMMRLDRAPMLRGMYFGGDNWGDLYFLWSLERMAVIYDLEQVGGKDWYKWGSEILLGNQSADGSWRERFPGVPDTCFALLFLKRANVVKDLTDKLREARLAAAAGAPPNLPAPQRKKD